MTRPTDPARRRTLASDLTVMGVLFIVGALAWALQPWEWIVVIGR